MNKTLVTVKVEKAGKSVLDWYAISVSPDQNFPHVLEAISQASTHALNVSRFKKPVRVDDFSSFELLKFEFQFEFWSFHKFDKCLIKSYLWNDFYL